MSYIKKIEKAPILLIIALAISFIYPRISTDPLFENGILGEANLGKFKKEFTGKINDVEIILEKNIKEEMKYTQVLISIDYENKVDTNVELVLQDWWYENKDAIELIQKNEKLEIHVKNSDRKEFLPNIKIRGNINKIKIDDALTSIIDGRFEKGKIPNLEVTSEKLKIYSLDAKNLTIKTGFKSEYNDTLYHQNIDILSVSRTSNEQSVKIDNLKILIRDDINNISISKGTKINNIEISAPPEIQGNIHMAINNLNKVKMLPYKKWEN